MMATGSLEWIRPPGDIARVLAQRTAAMDPALHALAQATAARGETVAKGTTAYQDQTGNLRGGTFGRANGTDITIGATASYAPFVELGTSRMAARPFLEPTAQQLAPEYFHDAGELVTRLLGG